MKILIIEDEKELSKSIVTYLKEDNYVCETALDYRTAVSTSDLYTDAL